MKSRPLNELDPLGLEGTGAGSAKKEKCNCGPEITDWFVSELNIHAAFWREVRKNIPPIWRPLYFKPYAASIPYKWMTFATQNCATGAGCKNTVTICGTCIHKSELGNIMFGATAKIFLVGELLIIGAASQLGKGGPDSIEDIAGVIGGLTLGPLLNTGNINKLAFCNKLRSNQSAYILKIQEGFKEGGGISNLLGELSTVREITVSLEA